MEKVINERGDNSSTILFADDDDMCLDVGALMLEKFLQRQPH
jgi:hypothetical protein